MKLMERIKQVISQYVPVASSKTSVTPDNPNDPVQEGGWGKYFDEVLQKNAPDKVKYQDYDLMDSEVPEITAALDVIADFVVYPDNVNKNKMFEVKNRKANKQVSETIDKINQMTQFPRHFVSIVRETCKNGDNVEELLRGADLPNPVAGLKNVPIDSVNIQMENGILNSLYPVTQFNSSGEIIAKLRPDECLHFHLSTDRKRYFRTGKGVSRIEKCRLIYRQLRLMEEGVMISQLSRANQNYAHLVDVGDLTGDEALDFIEKYRRRITRKKYIDPSTGRMSFKFNPLSVMEDILLPTRQGSGANVISLNNSSNSDKAIVVNNYFQNKLIYATGVPKLLIGKEDDVNSKSTSDVQYISFLRLIRQIQCHLEPEIIHFYTVALASHGITDVDLYVEWPIMGTIDEERKWRIEQMKATLASTLSSDLQLVDDYWIYENLMGMDEDEIEELVNRMDETEAEYLRQVAEDMAQAKDMTGDPDGNEEFTADDGPEAIPTKKKKPTAKDDEEDDPPSAEEVTNHFRQKLDEKAFDTFQKFQNILGANEALRKVVCEWVQLTRAKLGE